VREKDFLGLAENFKTWAEEMATKYGVFLEIQRGAWDSQSALQRQNPTRKPQFKDHAYAFDLIKVYGAGWLREPGTAFGNNAPFLPGGAIFKKIMNSEEEGVRFGVDDLYAAYCLKVAADGYQFGRNAPEPSRRQTRFLFYMIVLELLRDVMIRANMNPSEFALTNALIKLLRPANYEALKALQEKAVEAVDEYLTKGSDNSVFSEAALNDHLSTYLKSDQFGKIDGAASQLRNLLVDYKRYCGNGPGGQPSPRQLVTAAIMQ